VRMMGHLSGEHGFARGAGDRDLEVVEEPTATPHGQRAEPLPVGGKLAHERVRDVESGREVADQRREEAVADLRLDALHDRAQGRIVRHRRRRPAAGIAHRPDDAVFPRAQGRTPATSVRMRYTPVSAVMYSVRPSASPQARLCCSSGKAASTPRSCASGERIQTPPGPATQRCPSRSTLRPSIAASPGALVMSKKTAPGPRVPSSCTGYRMTTLRSGSQFPTYKKRSSGENAMPFGPRRSVVRSCTAPSFARNTPAYGSSFRGSAEKRGRPKSGSVK